MTQYGFYYNQDLCIGCMTCQVACKDANDLPVGTLYRHVTGFETGTYPNVGRYLYSATCNHCEEPACVQICPAEALYKDEETGLVLLHEENCTGCKSCMTICPYQVPQYLEDKGIIGKCFACTNAPGETNPACVASCVTRALEFGDVEELRSKHSGENLVQDLPCLPPSSQTSPSTLIMPRDAALEKEFSRDVCW